jgi:hypothetical protein
MDRNTKSAAVARVESHDKSRLTAFATPMRILQSSYLNRDEAPLRG